jgi:protein tyrosine phosphatase
MSPPPVPLWLQRAYNQDHINNVWRILVDRERSRIRARLLSFCHNRAEPSSSPSPHSAAIQLLSGSYPGGHISDHYSTAIGCSPENHVCNRYSDILPYDRTRVDVGGRYFNADWVRELAGGRWTIATQAPLPNTAYDFLSLIAGTHPPLGPPEESSLKFTRVRTAVQLTQNFESGKQKAHPYFPHEPGESAIVRPPQQHTFGLPLFKVTLVKSEVIESAQCLASTVSITSIAGEVPSSSVIFHHLLYGAWPDHGIPEPEDRVGLLNFIRLVDRTNKDMRGLEAAADVEPPIMVNCSAGVGRTGCFIALCSLLRSNGLLSQPDSERAPIRPPPLPQSPLGSLPESISWDEVGQEIDSLREQRPAMVQQAEQALLVYEILISAFLARS